MGEVNKRLTYKQIKNTLFWANDEYLDEHDMLTPTEGLIINYFHNKIYQWLDLLNKGDSEETITAEEVFNEVIGTYRKLGYDKELSFGETLLVRDYLQDIISKITGIDYLV